MKYEITDIHYVITRKGIATAYFIAKDEYGVYFIKSININAIASTHHTRHYSYESALLHLQRDVKGLKPATIFDVNDLNYLIDELYGH